MRVTHLCLLLFLTAFSFEAAACRPQAVSIEHRASTAQSIYVGYVTAVRFIEYENSLKNGEDPERVFVHEDVEIKAFVTETLKGESQEFVYASTNNCGGSEISPHQKVVIFVYPSLPSFVVSANSALEETQKALQKSR